MTTPGALNDGTPLRYAMGIANLTRGGRRVIEHWGNISGFSSHLAYYPEEDLTIAVLMNTNYPAERLAREIAEAVLGSRFVPPRSFGGDVAPFAGTYDGRVAGRPDEIRFEARGADLYYGRQRLQYLGSDTFGLDDVLFVFQRENGHVSRVRRDTVDTNLVLSRTPALTQ